MAKSTVPAGPAHTDDGRRISEALFCKLFARSGGKLAREGGDEDARSEIAHGRAASPAEEAAQLPRVEACLRDYLFLRHQRVGPQEARLSEGLKPRPLSRFLLDRSNLLFIGGVVELVHCFPFPGGPHQHAARRLLRRTWSRRDGR